MKRRTLLHIASLCFVFASLNTVLAADDSVTKCNQTWKGMTKDQVKVFTGPPSAVWSDERHPDGSRGDTWICHEVFVHPDTGKKESIKVYFNAEQKCVGVAWR